MLETCLEPSFYISKNYFIINFFCFENQQIECGERNDESRIVGGNTAIVNAYPWMARLSYFNR